MTTSPSERPLTQRYVSAMKSHWLLIALCVGVSGGLAAAYCVFVEPVYEAEARVLIQDLGLALDEPAKKTYDKQFLSTQAERIQSPTTIERALTTVSSPVGDGADEILKRLRVSLLANTDIALVTFQDANPAYAAAMLEAVIESYRADLRSVEQGSATETQTLLAEREQSLRTELRLLEERHAVLRRESLLVGDVDDTVSMASAELRDLTNRLTELSDSRTQLQTFLVAFNESNSSLGSKLAGGVGEFSSSDDRLRQQQIEATTDLARARSLYGDRHPARLAAEERVTSLELARKAERERVLAEMRTRIGLMEIEESSLSQRVEATRQDLKSIDHDSLEEQHLVADIERVRALHASTLESLKASELAGQALAEGRSSIFVHVLDPFVAPESPLWPKPIPLIAIACLIGAAVACGAVLLLDELPMPGLIPTPALAAGSAPSAANHEEQVVSRIESLEASVGSLLDESVSAERSVSLPT